MPRILLFIALAFIVWFFVRWIGSSRRRDDATPSARAPEARAVESMRQCAWCGAHLPAGEALALPDGRAYCGVPHRDAALAAGPDAGKDS